MARIYRDRWNKKLGGVCGGLGAFLKIDPSLIRFSLVPIALFTGILPLLFAYIIAWILLPEGPLAYIEGSYKRLYRSRTNRRIAGVCGGLAAYFGIDATVVRALYAIALILTGGIPLILTYIAALSIIPEKTCS